MYWERLQAVLQKRKCYGFGNVMVWEGEQTGSVEVEAGIRAGDIR
jgi:hypothetical protein